MKKSKKWLSLLTVAAMAVTSVSGTGVTVGAAETESVTVEESELKLDTSWYTQDFTDITDASTVATSTNAQDYLVIASDDTHGNYLSFDVSSASSLNSRGAYMDFDGVDVSGEDSYVVEFDAAITPGNNQQTYFTVKGTDFAYLGSNINNGAGSGWLLNLVNTAGGSTTYTLNTTAEVTIPSGEWCHYLLYVDQSTGLVSTTITGESTGTIADKVVTAYDGDGDVAGLYMLAGRYYAVESVDNIVVRAVTDEDEFGEIGEETLSSAEFSSALNVKITQPEDAVHYPITVKGNGSLGGDLTESVSVEWSVVGLDDEDGYVSLTKEEGTGEGTDGEDPDGTTAYFNVRNGVSNYFGYVQAVVSYGDDSYTIQTPFAILGASSASSTQLAPMGGYYEDMNDYADSLVGYQATANGITDQDLVLNGWSIYGSNSARTLTLVSDDDGTKSLEFASNSGSGSTVAIYQWTDQTSQYIMDFTAKFNADMAFGVYYNTPNNSDGNPEWSASFSSGALTVGTETISGLSTGEWYRYVISADPSIQTYTVTVYDSTGEEVGETAEVDMANDSSTQKYFCFYGTYPMYLQSFKAYLPTLSTISVAAEAEVVKVPEDGEDASTVDLSASLLDVDGIKITGAVDWSLEDEYANVELVSTGAQTATLTVNEGASGTVTVIATKDGKQAEITIQLTTSSNVVSFTQSTSSLTIPFAGEDDVTATFTAITRDGSGEEIDGGTITYALLAKDGVTETTVSGVTFADGVLTVAAGASPAVVYVKATNEEGLTAKVKVNIHGLSFAFGSQDAEEGYTQVEDTLYTEKLGYGFLTTDDLTVNEDSVSGSAEYRFKAAVPNGNYVVTVDTTADSMLSEVVESVTSTTGITKTGSTFNVAVCDGVLDLTFTADSSVTTLVISQAAEKSALSSPMVYAIGDSTTSNTASGAKSWGNCVADGDVTVPDCFSGFSNHGMAGRDSVNYYNQGRVEAVLLSICPGDYVTVNMGINSSETGESASYYTLMKQYYVEGIIQRGGIPVIVTATPIGFSSSMYPYDSTTGTFLTSRDNYGNSARNAVLRQIAEEEGIDIIELGRYFEDYMNSLTEEDVAAYNEAQGTSCTTVLEMVQDWYVDHNHYKQYLGILIGEYLLGELETIYAEDSSAVTSDEGSETTPDEGSETTPDEGTTTPDSETTTDSETTSGSETTTDSETTSGSETTTDSETTSGSETTTGSETTSNSETTSGSETEEPDSGTRNVGDTFTKNKATYKVTKKDAEVEYVSTSATKKVTIPATVTIDGTKYKVTSIASGAFKNNKKVTQVVIGNNVTAIGANAFSGCTKLKSVTIGKKVKTIGKKAFYGCSALKTITIKSTKLTSVKSNAFKGIHAKAKIKVPAKKLSAYKKLLKGKGQGSKVKITKE